MNVLKKSLLVFTALLGGIYGAWAMNFTGEEEIKDDGKTPKPVLSSPQMEKRKTKKEPSQTLFGEEIKSDTPPSVDIEIQRKRHERITQDIIDNGLNFIDSDERVAFLQTHRYFSSLPINSQKLINDVLFGSIPSGFPEYEEERKLINKDRTEGFMARASFYNVMGNGDCLLYVLGKPREILIEDILTAGKRDTLEALALRNVFTIPINLKKGRDINEATSVNKEEFEEFVSSFRAPKKYLPPEIALAYGQLLGKQVYLWKINPEEKNFQDYMVGSGASQPVHIGFVNGNHYQILIDEANPNAGCQAALAQAKEHKARQQWQRVLAGLYIEEDKLFLTEAEENDIIASFQSPEQMHRGTQKPLQMTKAHAALNIKKGTPISIEGFDYTPSCIEDTLSWEDSDEEQNPPTSFHYVELRPRDKIVLAKSIYIGGKIYDVLDKIFDPSKPLEFSESFTEQDLQNKDFLEIFNNENPLLQRAKDLISDFKFNKLVTDEEYSGLMELMVRALMVLRPHHFSSLPDSGPVSSEIAFKIFQNFLEEFVNEGPLEKFERFVKNKIEQEQNPFTRMSELFFLELVTNFLRSTVTEPGMLGEFLRNLAPEQMDRHLKSMFHHLKILDPTLTDLTDPAMLEKHTKEKSKKRELEQLTKLLKSIRTEDDLLEDNFLRSFSERLHRENLGKAFYKMACESFANPAKENKKVRKMWALSLLDTINRDPMEARSRMPRHSFDGQTAPNFGYLMSQSPSYEEWIRQSPVTLATADVIMDAFDYVTNWGKNLSDDEKNEFLDLFEFHLTVPCGESTEFREFANKNRKELDAYYESPYSGPIVSFERYLLKRCFNEPCKKDIQHGNVLKSLADSQKVCLRDFANQHLENFKEFCSTTSQISNAQGRDRGFVFGIGFNGPLFNAPNYFHSSKNEICIAFSGSRRKENGHYLFLDFLEHFSREPNRGFISSNIKIDDHNFPRYKPLILNRLRYLVDLYSRYAKIDEGSVLFPEYKQFKSFTDELEPTDFLSELNSDLMKWIQSIGNWYRVPVNQSYYIPIKIPKELSKEEKNLQEYTRHLLLDAVVKRPLSKEKRLRSVLFLHWRERLLKKFVTEEELWETIKNVKSFKQVPESEKRKVLETLDSFVWDINEDIQSHWLKSIQNKLDANLEAKEISIRKQIVIKQNEINKINREISGLENQIRGKEKKKPNEENNKEAILYYQQISTSYSKIRDKFFRIRDVYLEIANLYIDFINTPRLLADLSIRGKYRQFSASFFEDRDVAICIEPLFSKALGHDRFFPVHVCNKPVQDGKIILGHLSGGRNFIDPCNQRCQHHVLGHLYVGDMCSYQTANQLDKNRRTHNLGSVPNRLIPQRIFQ